MRFPSTPSSLGGSVSLSFQCRLCDSDHLSNLLKVIQLVNSRGKCQTRFYLTTKPALFCPTPLRLVRSILLRHIAKTASKGCTNLYKWLVNFHVYWPRIYLPLVGFLMYISHLYNVFSECPPYPLFLFSYCVIHYL